MRTDHFAIASSALAAAPCSGMDNPWRAVAAETCAPWALPARSPSRRRDGDPAQLKQLKQAVAFYERKAVVVLGN